MESPVNWHKGSKRRLNSEQNKTPPKTTGTTTSSPGLVKNVEKNTEPIIRSRVLFKEDPNLKEPVIKDRDYKVGVDMAKGQDWSACGVCGRNFQICKGHTKEDLAKMVPYPTEPELKGGKVVALTKEEHKEVHQPTKESIKTLYEDSDFKHNKPVKKPEPVEVKLPLELIFGFEKKKVKFISEEKLNAVINKVIPTNEKDATNMILNNHLKKELGI